MPRIAPLRLGQALQQLDETRQTMQRHGVHFVHGSNSSSLHRVAREGGLLSMDELEKRGLADKITSGESGNTRVAGRGQPIREGVSLYGFQNYSQSTHYSELDNSSRRSGARSKPFPVLYGVNNVTQHPKAGANGVGHPLSMGSINATDISAVYVRSGDRQRALDQFRRIDSPESRHLQDVLHPFDALFPAPPQPSGTQPPSVNPAPSNPVPSRRQAPSRTSGNSDVFERLHQDALRRQSNTSPPPSSGPPPPRPATARRQQRDQLASASNTRRGVSGNVFSRLTQDAEKRRDGKQ